MDEGMDMIFPEHDMLASIGECAQKSNFQQSLNEAMPSS
jgi:hypothetical protein